MTTLRYFFSITSLYVTIVGITFLSIVPVSALAASTTPSCSLTATTSGGSVSLKGSKNTIVLTSGDSLGLSWKSINATKAVDPTGKSVGVNGTSTTTPTSSEKLSYTFSNGSKKVTCGVSVQINTIVIDPTTLIVSDATTKPILTGTANGTKDIRLVISSASTKNVVYDSKVLKVKSSKFTAKLANALPQGTYTVTVYGNSKANLNKVLSTTLSVGIPPATLNVSSIPLLSGGTVRASGLIPVSYLQIVNPGNTPVAVNGFWIREDGSTPVVAIAGLSTVDDKGGSRGEAGGSSGVLTFRNNVAYVPTTAVINAGQQKLFTIKALLTPAAGAYANTALKLNVTGVDAAATFRGSFPIIGTTWTIAAN